MDHALAFVATLSLDKVPAPANRAQAATEWERWHQTAQAMAETAPEAKANPTIGLAMIEAARHPAAKRWLDAVFGNSPYLTRLAMRDPHIVTSVFARGPDVTLAEVLGRLNPETTTGAVLPETRAAVMSRLRVVKRHAALVVGLADIAELWPLERVTGALSALADGALSAALRHLLTDAAATGQIVLAHPDDPERDSGVIILGMGKLGAHELNYSSDIDIIVLFDNDLITYVGRESTQEYMARLTRNLVKLFEDRTTDGYVFRTDLRLRPDPGSTPPAVSVAAAEGYYGSLGQNWERAAMIKARAVAGDIAAGRRFLKALTPFLWRKHLDFAAIRDIHSIKRQIEARHGDSLTTIAGHNVKLGHGGIREIEFFAQTQQLIWGGRLPNLRTSGTVETLNGLVEAGRIEQGVADILISAYRYLRQVEHRLQMIDDTQTHTLPTAPEALDRLAIFMGYPDTRHFADALSTELTRVGRLFGDLFRDAPTLSAEGNLVFTGKEIDPETLATLAQMGFKGAERIATAIRGWHHGRLRAMRSQRARELLTELTPTLLRALARSADPDFTFARFEEFLERLPAGVQLFSLFQYHPELLALLAEIMGEAPYLAAQLSRKPLLLDAVLSGSFFQVLSDDEDLAGRDLARDLEMSLARARDYEDVLDLTRRWTNDRKFQTGVLLMKHQLDGERAGRDFSLIAETVVSALSPRVMAEFARQHGTVPGGEFVILGLGKFGSREMTALSDLDLIFIYDAPPETETSDGPKPLAVTAYFARLGQRVINALTALTGEGNLYETDMRLRPSGAAGPLASSLEAFRRYHEGQAWTWERMALTRARVCTGSPVLAKTVGQMIHGILTKPRDAASLVMDVASMRDRIAKQHPKPLPWDCKHRRGGLIDLEFIAQYLQLRHASDTPAILAQRTADALQRLIEAGHLAPGAGRPLLAALGFWHEIQGVLRVVVGKPEGETADAALIARVLERATGLSDAQACLAELARNAETVLACYDDLISRPAEVFMLASPSSPEASRT